MALAVTCQYRANKCLDGGIPLHKDNGCSRQKNHLWLSFKCISNYTTGYELFIQHSVKTVIKPFHLILQHHHCNINLFPAISKHSFHFQPFPVIVSNPHYASAPALANGPESEHVHFILHIEYCTLHATCLYCILKMYNFTLQTSKICLGWFQDLHGEMYLGLAISKGGVISSVKCPCVDYQEFWLQTGTLRHCYPPSPPPVLTQFSSSRIFPGHHYNAQVDCRLLTTDNCYWLVNKEYWLQTTN